MEQQRVFPLTGGNHHPEALEGVLEVVQHEAGAHTTSALQVRSEG